MIRREGKPDKSIVRKNARQSRFLLKAFIGVSQRPRCTPHSITRGISPAAEAKPASICSGMGYARQFA
jgi:hypothetical protein